MKGNPVVALGFATLDFLLTMSEVVAVEPRDISTSEEELIVSCCGGTKYVSSSEELIIQRPRKLGLCGQAYRKPPSISNHEALGLAYRMVDKEIYLNFRFY